MSINWVMLHERDGFIHLPHEQLIYTSPPRTGLSLHPLGSSNSQDSFSVQSSTGRIYLTNQRVVYIPTQKSPELQSFSAPLLNIHDSHVTAPFFGPNVWIALVQPVSGGGIPASIPAVQCKITFKEGGAFDFHNHFERIQERLQQVVDVSQETSRGASNLNMSSVHLEELPAYSGPSNGSAEPRPGSPTTTTPLPPQTEVTSEPSQDPEPMEPPPGYEEVQQQSVANVLEERLRRAS
ncbi:hypothetical protein BDV59DRAFT_181134 [Aspergillus ambiguus]|uniref:uncharacterized protein n=1 Tax=Aspergillus ambiguus TaxID=176160 RepID=UPI003CCCD75F